MITVMGCNSKIVHQSNSGDEEVDIVNRLSRFSQTGILVG
jgi:hypothetical protein